jgi:hypothetical protein
MFLAWGAVKMHAQWRHIARRIAAQGFIADGDMGLYFGLGMPYDDGLRLQVTCDNDGEVPVLQNHVPALNWTSNNSRVEFAQIFDSCLVRPVLRDCRAPRFYAA